MHELSQGWGLTSTLDEWKWSTLNTQASGCSSKRQNNTHICKIRCKGKHMYGATKQKSLTKRRPTQLAVCSRRWLSVTPVLHRACRHVVEGARGLVLLTADRALTQSECAVPQSLHAEEHTSPFTRVFACPCFTLHEQMR